MKDYYHVTMTCQGRWDGNAAVWANSLDEARARLERETNRRADYRCTGYRIGPIGVALATVVLDPED